MMKRVNMYMFSIGIYSDIKWMNIYVLTSCPIFYIYILLYVHSREWYDQKNPLKIMQNENRSKLELEKQNKILQKQKSL